MRFTCQSCGRAYAVSDELSGRAFKMKCKGCGQEIVVRPANPATGKPAETTGMVPLPVASAAPPPRAAPPPPPQAAPPPPPQAAPPPPPQAAPPPPPQAAPPPPPQAAPPPPPQAAPPPPARLKEAPPSRPAAAPQQPPPAGPVEYDLDPLAGLDDEIEAAEAAAPPPPPAPPAKLAARDVPRGPVASSARAKPATTPPSRRSLLIPGIALFTVLFVLGVGISFLRAKPPGRAPVPAAPTVETPVLAAAPRLEPQPAAPPASSPPAGAEIAAPRASEKPSPALSPALPPARSPATARAERLQAATDLPVERAPAEIVPPPARQPAATAAPPPNPGPALVATTSPPLDVSPAPVPVAVASPVAVAPTLAVAPTVADAPALATPAPGPTYVGDKFQAPRLASRTCIAEKLRLPSRLDDDGPEVVTVRVEVGVTGIPRQVQVLEGGVDPRISDAIRRAVLACEWVPGADAQGKPAQFWAVQPLRLAR